MSKAVESNDSKNYPIKDINSTGQQNAELSIVQAQSQDLAQEEFPEGPYGAATNEKKLGKVSPWKPGQRSGNRFRDANPISSDRTIPLREPEADAPIGTIEGQN